MSKTPQTPGQLRSVGGDRGSKASPVKAYSCTSKGPAELCPQCERRYRAILAMYGISEETAEVTRMGELVEKSLRRLCYFAQLNEGRTPR